MQPRRGDLLADRYRLVEPRGRGGMAVVWAAHDELLHRRVAVKVMGAHLLDDPGALARFRREGRAAARLNHANVVALYDAVSDGDVHFLVMELLEGGSLADRLRQGPLGPAAALEVLDQVAAGLGTAHEHGIVHRDIKPSNVLFASNGTAKVADFGIATAVVASATMTHTVHGSVPYMAPEQATGATPDPRTDLYALGCLAHEMVTGAPPFVGDTPAAVISQHLHADPPELPDSGNDRLAEGLQAVIRRLIAKDPVDRHPTAPALREDLARVRRGEPPLAAAAPEAGNRGRDDGDTPSTGRDALTAALPGVTPSADRSAPTAALGSTTLGPAARDAATTTAEPREGRRGWWWLLVPVVLLVAVLAASALDDGDDEVALADVVTAVTATPTTSVTPVPRQSSPTPVPTPTTAAPAASGPSPAGPPDPTTPAAPTAPGASEPPATTAPTEPAGPSAETRAAIAAIRDLVADGLERGQLDDEGAAAIEAALDDPRDVDGLRATVASLVDDGHANPGIANQLDAAIDDLAATYA